MSALGRVWCIPLCIQVGGGCMCTCMPAEQRITSGVISQRSLHLFCFAGWLVGWRLSLLLTWNLPSRLGWLDTEPQGSTDSASSKLWLQVPAITPRYFYVGFGDSNLGHCVCRARASLTEPTPWNSIFLFPDYASFRNEHKRRDSGKGWHWIARGYRLIWDLLDLDLVLRILS